MWIRSSLIESSFLNTRHSFNHFCSVSKVSKTCLRYPTPPFGVFFSSPPKNTDTDLITPGTSCWGSEGGKYFKSSCSSWQTASNPTTHSRVCKAAKLSPPSTITNVATTTSQIHRQKVICNYLSAKKRSKSTNAAAAAANTILNILEEAPPPKIVSKPKVQQTFGNSTRFSSHSQLSRFFYKGHNMRTNGDNSGRIFFGQIDKKK